MTVAGSTTTFTYTLSAAATSPATGTLTAGKDSEFETLESGATATWSAAALASSTYTVYAHLNLYDGDNNPLSLDSQAQYTITGGGVPTTVTVDQNPKSATYSVTSLTYNNTSGVATATMSNSYTRRRRRLHFRRLALAIRRRIRRHQRDLVHVHLRAGRRAEPGCRHGHDHGRRAGAQRQRFGVQQHVGPGDGHRQQHVDQHGQLRDRGREHRPHLRRCGLAVRWHVRGHRRDLDFVHLRAGQRAEPGRRHHGHDHRRAERRSGSAWARTPPGHGERRADPHRRRLAQRVDGGRRHGTGRAAAADRRAGHAHVRQHEFGADPAGHAGPRPVRGDREQLCGLRGTLQSHGHEQHHGAGRVFGPLEQRR